MEKYIQTGFMNNLKDLKSSQICNPLSKPQNGSKALKENCNSIMNFITMAQSIFKPIIMSISRWALGLKPKYKEGNKDLRSIVYTRGSLLNKASYILKRGLLILEKSFGDLNVGARYIITCALSKNKYNKFYSYKTSKDMWNIIQITYEGTKDIQL
ncbi:hypothetical protein CR513_33054, partial [Mucuna pruriens]